jgi:cold shock CspA family protein
MRVQGTITAVFALRGYAWAEPDNERVSAFAHFNETRGKKQMLRMGDRIEFELVDTPKGLKAEDIEIIVPAPKVAS